MFQRRPRNGGAVPPRTVDLSSLKEEKQDAVFVCPRFAPQRTNGEALMLDIGDKGELTLHTRTETHDGRADQEERKYKYANVFGMQTKEDELFKSLWNEASPKLREGYNATILCYGQTGSGKTHTVSNMLPRATQACFDWAEELEKQPGASLKIEISYLQIYLDSVYDLLGGGKDSKHGDALNVKNKGMDSLPKKYITIKTAAEAVQLVKKGNRWRATNAHALNDRSSRSHTMYFLTITKRGGDGADIQSTLLIVDLAGSERAHRTKASGSVFEEGKAINMALTTLGRVMEGLSKNDKVIPFRENILTMYLKETLTNSFFALICCCSSDRSDEDETRCTLKFGSVAKNVQITRQANELMKQRAVAKEKKIVFEQTIANLNETHQTEITSLEKQISENRNKERQWKKEAQTIKSQLENEKSNLKAVEDDLSSLAKELKQKEDEAMMSMANLNEVRGQYDVLQEEIKREHQLREATENERIRLERSLQEDIRKAQEDKERLEATLQGDIERVERERIRLETDIRGVQEEKESLEQALEEDSRKAKKERAQLEANIRAAQEDREKLEHELQTDVKRAKQEKETLEREILRLQNDKARMEKALEEDKTRAQHDRELLEESIRQTQDEKILMEKKLHAEARQAQEERAFLEESIHRVKEDKAYLETTLQADAERAREERTRLEEDIRRTQEDKSQLERTLHTETMRATEEREQLEDAIRKVQDDKDSMGRQLQADMMKAQHEKELLEKTLQADIKKATEQSRRLEQQLTDNTEALQRTTQKSRVAENDLAERRAELRDIKNELETAIQGRDELRQKEETLTHEIGTLAEQVEDMATELKETDLVKKQLVANLRVVEKELAEKDADLERVLVATHALKSEKEAMRYDRDEAKKVADKYQKLAQERETQAKELQREAELIERKADEEAQHVRQLKRKLQSAEEVKETAHSEIIYLEEGLRQAEERATSAESAVNGKNAKILELEKVLQKEKKMRKEENTQLHREIEEVRDRQAAESKKRSELQQKNELLKAKLAQVTASAANWKQEAEISAVEKDDTQMAFENLQYDMKEKECSLQEIKKKAFKIEEHSMDMEVQLAKLASEGETRQQVEEQNEKLQVKLKATSAKRHEEEEEHKRVQRQMEETLSEALCERDSLRGSRSEVIELRKQLEELQAAYLQQVQETAAAKAEQEKLLRRLEEAEGEMAAEKELACNLKDELQKLQDELEVAVSLDMKEHLENEVELTKEQLQNSIDTIAEMERELQILADRHETAVMLSEAQTKKCGQLSTECKTSVHDLQQARTELEENTKRVSDLRAAQRKILIEKNRLTKNYEGLKSRSKDVQGKEKELKMLSTFKNRASNMERKAKGLEGKQQRLIEGQKMEVAANRKLNMELAKKNKEIRSAEAKYRKDLAKKKSEKERAEARATLLEEKLNSYKRDLEKKTGTVKEMSDRVRETEKEAYLLKHILDQKESGELAKKGIGLGIGQRFSTSPGNSFLGASRLSLSTSRASMRSPSRSPSPGGARSPVPRKFAASPAETGVVKAPVRRAIHAAGRVSYGRPVQTSSFSASPTRSPSPYKSSHVPSPSPSTHRSFASSM